jgi:hypothetical protein
VEVETLLTPGEVAARMRTTVGNLARKRSMKTGPPWIKVDGSVRYRWTDVSAWLDERTHPGGAA